MLDFDTLVTEIDITKHKCTKCGRIFTHACMSTSADDDIGAFFDVFVQSKALSPVLRVVNSLLRDFAYSPMIPSATASALKLSLNLGCAIEMISSTLSLIDVPLKDTHPYSVTR